MLDSQVNFLVKLEKIRQCGMRYIHYYVLIHTVPFSRFIVLFIIVVVYLLGMFRVAGI